MNYKIKILVFVSIYLAVFTGCGAFRTAYKYFNVQDAFYQSWIKNENQRGTHVTIILKNVNPDIEFDSIVFRNSQMPVSVENKENSVILTASTLTLIPELKDGSVPVNKQDQLLFKINGQRHSFLIKKFRREKMKYY